MSIMINQEVVCTVSGHPYVGKTGTVVASRLSPANVVEHQVRFEPRTFSPEEIDRGEDRIPGENLTWFEVSEIAVAT